LSALARRKSEHRNRTKILGFSGGNTGKYSGKVKIFQFYKSLYFWMEFCFFERQNSIFYCIFRSFLYVIYMKLLHTSDWHLGRRRGAFSRLEGQQAVLQEICEFAEREQRDAVLVAGDLFDTFNPSADAVDLFYKALRKLADNGKRPVIAIAGNHDSPDR